MQNTSNEGLTEQRKEHTLRTIEAIGILEEFARENERLKMAINDRDLKIQGLEVGHNISDLVIQELKNELLMARSLNRG